MNWVKTSWTVLSISEFTFLVFLDCGSRNFDNHNDEQIYYQLNIKSGMEDMFTVHMDNGHKTLY